MCMDILLGALAGLSGVLVGGALQHFTSQRAIDRQHKWERSRLVHEKLELIAQEANEIGQRMMRLYSGAIVSVESGDRYNPEIALPFAKLEMLLNFYALELKPEYDQLLALRDEMSDTIADLVIGRIPADKKDRQQLNLKLINASFKAEKICDQMIHGASKLGRECLDMNVE